MQEYQKKQKKKPSVEYLCNLSNKWNTPPFQAITPHHTITPLTTAHSLKNPKSKGGPRAVGYVLYTRNRGFPNPSPILVHRGYDVEINSY